VTYSVTAQLQSGNNHNLDVTRDLSAAYPRFKNVLTRAQQREYREIIADCLTKLG
jgi:hypothetical protein